MINRAECGVLPVRVENWGSTKVRIASIPPHLTRNSQGSLVMPKAVYPEAERIGYVPPATMDSEKTARDVSMSQGIKYSPQSLQRAVGFST